ncbi:hypothetical protein D3C71_1478490 [compost metagenome]
MGRKLGIADLVDTAENNRRIVKQLMPVLKRKIQSGVVRCHDDIDLNIRVFALDQFVEALEVLLARIPFPIQILGINDGNRLRLFQPVHQSVILIVRPLKAFMVRVKDQHILRRSIGSSSGIRCNAEQHKEQEY